MAGRRKGVCVSKVRKREVGERITVKFRMLCFGKINSAVFNHLCV